MQKFHLKLARCFSSTSLLALLLLTVLPGGALAATERTVVVDPIGDTDQALGCTLREAIDLANAGLISAIGCDAIEVGTGTPITYRLELPAYTYVLTGGAGNDDNTGGDLDFFNTGVAVEIVGAGAEQTIIDGGGVDRVFHIPFSVDLSVSSVTIQNGDSGNASGGGVYQQNGSLIITDSVIRANSAGFGGGILSVDTLTLERVWFTGNSASSWGGGLYTASSLTTIADSKFSNNSAGGLGGGVSNEGNTLSISGSAFVGNRALDGGGIRNSGSLNLANSTLAGNSARRYGGGIAAAGQVRLTAVTAVENIADSDENGVGAGGGIYRIGFGGSFAMRGVLLANNLHLGGSSHDCQGSFNSAGYNLVANNSGCVTSFPGGSPNANSDFVGTAGIPLDPQLRTPTGDPLYYPLEPGSIAIDQLTPTDCVFQSTGTNPLFTAGDPITIDQRGVFRDTACDIGAFEFFITVDPIVGLTTTESGTTAQFDVALPTAPTADVTIPVTSSDTSEGVPDVASLLFTTVDWADVRTITVTGQDDDVVDGDNDYMIELGLIQSADGLYAGVDPADVMLTNEDDDVAGFGVVPTAGLQTSEAGGTAMFEVALTSEPVADVVIALASSDPGEGTIGVSTLTFTALDWDQPQPVTITGQDDAIVDGDVAYSIELGFPTTTDANYAAIDPDDVQVTNLDDADTAGIVVMPVAGLTTSETGTTDSFTVVLTSEPTASITVPISSSDPGEGVTDVSSLTFTALDWDQPQTVTITGQDDAIVDGDVVYTVELGLPTTTDANYAVIDPDDVEATNSDDADTAGVLVTPTSGLTTTETGGQAFFDVVLTSQPTGDVAIAVESQDITEGLPDVLSLTFTTLDWDQPQTVTVTGQDDAQMDGDIVYTIALGVPVSSDANYTAIDPDDVELANEDDDFSETIFSDGFESL